MAVRVPEWVKDAVFYLIFPDRFASSSRLEKPGNIEPWYGPPTTYGFRGGDLLGIAERLDYLQDLGITALLINPIFSSVANHRYHTINYFEVDPLLGGNKAFDELLREAHRRNMRVVLDGVFNHTGRGFYQFIHTLENGIKSLYLDWFHFNIPWLESRRGLNAFPPEPTSLDAADDTLSLKEFGYKGWWNMPALPKLNTNNPEVREFLLSVGRFWLEKGIDGWRLDVPGEINDDSFWQQFRNTVKGANPEAYIVGEIWEDGRRWLQGDQFDAVMNYMFTKAALGFFGGSSLDLNLLRSRSGLHSVRHLSAEEFRGSIDYLLSLYPSEVNFVQLNLLESHDTARCVSMLGGNFEALKLAALFMLCYPGAPCLYYGTEVGLSGGHDPDCRGTFPWDTKLWRGDLLEYYKKIIALRRNNKCLRRGCYESLSAQGSAYVCRRSLGDEEALIVVNPGDSAQNVRILHPLKRPLQFKEALTGRDLGLNDHGEAEINIGSRAGLVYLHGA